MKKIFALTFLACMTFCTLCSAFYSPSTAQWEWITSDSKTTDYYDKWGVTPNREAKTIAFNLLACYPQQNNHAILRVFIDYNAKTATILEGKLYDDTNKALIKDLNGSENYNIPVKYTPDSPMQKWADKLYIYMR